MEEVMQEGEELLRSLGRRGVRLWISEGKVHFQAPKGALSSEDLGRLRACKAELLELLRGSSPQEAEAPLRPREPGCFVPLTVTQLRWWRSIQQGLSQRLVNVSLRITGPLDIERLRRSIEVVVHRHESLRTRIAVEDGIPLQQIDPPSAYRLDCQDLSALAPEQALTEATQRARELIQERVDLCVGPLFAARLFSWSEREHVLILAFEHIITDAVSSIIVQNEILTAYRQASLGAAVALPDLRVQFADYAVWQARTCETWLRQHAEYWRSRLQDAPQLRLPIDNDLQATCPRHETLEVPFSGPVTARLRELARTRRTLPAVVALAIFVAAVARWCGQRDFVLLFISNARHRSELQNMVGFLANCLQLRIQIAQDDSFVSLLERVDLELRTAYEHQDFDRSRELVPECKPELSFNWISASWTTLSLDSRWQADTGVDVQPLDLNVRWPRTFLPVFYDCPQVIVATLTYRSDLFVPKTMGRFVDELRLLADGCCREPCALLSTLARSPR